MINIDGWIVQEAEKGTLTLEDDEDAISAMLHYFYHFDYVSDGSLKKGLLPVILDIRVFVIADKYMVYPLRDIAFGNIRTRLASEWDSEAFPTAIKEVYALDPVYEDFLKPEIMSMIASRRELLAGREQYKAFHNLMRELNDFAADAAIAVAASGIAGVGKIYKCPSCKGVFSVQPKYSSIGCPNPMCYTAHPLDWWTKQEVKD